MKFHKPVHRPADVIEQLRASGDPAETSALSHDTAAALLGRVRAAADPQLVERVIAYADEAGIDDVAELWANAPGHSLPGAMWRIYLLRHVVATDPEAAGYSFRRGVEVEGGPNRAIAGASSAPDPDEVLALATTILKGAFVGDFAVALERAAAFARVLAAGLDEQSATDEHSARAADERRRAQSHREMADDLRASARLWRAGALT